MTHHALAQFACAAIWRYSLILKEVPAGILSHGHKNGAEIQMECCSLFVKTSPGLDIDHFKHINDTFGHLKGDEILKEVAGVLKTTLRETDICARYGGEEFMLVLEHADKEKAKICAERLRQLIEARKFLQSEENFSVTASLGYTTYRPKEELSQMISRADEALYRAKNSGRNRVEAG